MRRNPRAACKINPEGHPRNGEKLRKKTRSGKEASYLTKNLKVLEKRPVEKPSGCPQKKKRERISKLADYSNKF
jgi:hypothetical protein